MEYKLSQYFVYTDLLDEAAEVPKRIIYSTRTGNAIIIKDTLLQHLQSGSFERISLSEINTLFNLELLVPADIDEFELMLEQNIVSQKDETTLSITIQPSANCQLGCHYCGQTHVKHTISDELSAKIAERIDKKLSTKKFKRLSTTWFGAEPLMGLSQIRNLSRQILDLCRKHNVLYSSMIITNGVSLKEDVARVLIEECHITLYQITIDSFKEYHDTRRITKKGGEPTFDIIFSNLLNLVSLDEYKQREAKVILRMNIDRTNYESIPRFIDFLADHQLQHKNVSVDFSPVLDWGGNGASQASLDKVSYSDQEIEWMIHAMGKGFQFHDIIPQRTYSPCMVVKDDDEVYDAYGNIYPCYELPYTKAYEGPEFLIGNLKMDEATYQPDAKPRQWFTDIKKGISWCVKCKFFPVCGGGCPKQWYNKEPACPSFKFNMEDRLALQYVLNHTTLNELV